jgi:hypothetical protein
VLQPWGKECHDCHTLTMFFADIPIRIVDSIFRIKFYRLRIGLHGFLILLIRKLHIAGQLPLFGLFFVLLRRTLLCEDANGLGEIALCVSGAATVGGKTPYLDWKRSRAFASRAAYSKVISFALSLSVCVCVGVWCAYQLRILKRLLTRRIFRMAAKIVFRLQHGNEIIPSLFRRF